MIVVDYFGPELLRSLAERFNIQIFDRVTGIRLLRDTPTSRVDFSAFSKLKRIAKPSSFKSSKELSHTPMGEEYNKRCFAEMAEHMTEKAKIELKYAIPSSQINKIDHNQFLWWVDLASN